MQNAKVLRSHHNRQLLKWQTRNDLSTNTQYHTFNQHVKEGRKRKKYNTIIFKDTMVFP